MERPERDEANIVHVLQSLTDCLDRLDSIDTTQPLQPLPKLTTTDARPPHTSSTRPLPQLTPFAPPPKQRYPPASPTPPPLPFRSNQSPSSTRRRLRERAFRGQTPSEQTPNASRRGVIEDARTSRIASLYSDDRFLGLKVEEIAGVARRTRRRRKKKSNQEREDQHVGGDGASCDGLHIDLEEVPWEVSELEDVDWRGLASAQLLQPVRVVTSPISACSSEEFYLKAFDLGFDEDSGVIPDE